MALLDSKSIRYQPPSPPGSPSSASFVSSIKDAIKQRTETQGSLGGVLQPTLDIARKVVSNARAAFANLSAHRLSAQANDPTIKTAGPHFVPRNADPGYIQKFHQTEITSALAALGSPDRDPGRLRLRLTPDELGAAGLSVAADGNVIGSVLPKIIAMLVAARGSEVDLIRVHSLLDLVESPDDQLNALTQQQPPGPGSPPNGTPSANGTVTKQQVSDWIVSRIAGQIQPLPGDPLADPLADPQNPAKVDPSPDAPKTVNDSISSLELTGGPADVTAFHDVQVLQIAFKDVWTEAFDGVLQTTAEQIYAQATRLYQDAGLTFPPPGSPGSFDDVEELGNLVSQIQAEANILTAGDPGSASPVVNTGLFGGLFPFAPTGPFGAPAGAPAASGGGGAPWLVIPGPVAQAFPDLSLAVWNLLSTDQQNLISIQASNPDTAQARQNVQAITSHPEGATGRLASLMNELDQSLAERYSFDVFAADTYNYGILLTYRQKWEPASYQVGNLVSTIPLAPGETRKYTKKRVTKETRTQKASGKSSAVESRTDTETQRAEVAIMNKVSLATNFKTTADGSIKIGLADFHGASEFKTSQLTESVNNVKTLHEATLKAAEEYRKETSVEVDVTTSLETEETYSGEISNPNNEITVTYLFYELQRRYHVSEQLHRARAVIMVAQEVPAPHEVDEAWLIEHQWIIGRALLDESLRPALTYLTSGFAGDEVSLDVLRAGWQAQARILDALEKKVILQMSMRDALRGQIAEAALGEAQAKAIDSNLAGSALGSIATGLFGDPGKIPADMLDAQRQMAQSLLDYTQSDLDDSQRKLQSATDAYQKATQEYTAALQKKFSRDIAIDQLRVHVKQNILYYMQAIWDHEPPDQRFFRLYHKQVYFPIAPTDASGTPVSPAPSPFDVGIAGTVNVGFDPLVGPDLGNQVDLIDVADLDNPLGYRGNYIIFPLKQACYLTSYMLQGYVDDYFGIRDPNELNDHPLEEVKEYIRQVWNRAGTTAAQQDALRKLFTRMLLKPQPSGDDIVVSTGQLYIEALPGRHPLLEDFKLKHRLEDVRKVQAEVRRAEMENLRLAARLVADPPLLQDPDIEKRIVVDKDVNVVVDSNP
jgi:hypothetical protein